MGPVERDENLYEVRSPAVGAFYRAPAPGGEPYVEAGRTLCIVETIGSVGRIRDLPANYSGDETIGVIYEGEAEVPGEVVEVLVEEAGEEELGRPLFHLRPGA